jgi:outer membrane receptor protein involved in Fe transport
MYKSNKLTRAVRLAITAGATSAVLAMPSAMAFAEETNAEEAVERIAVTGSRIRKAEFTSNAPVANVDSEQFTLSATVNTESLLNTLPQVVPGLDRSSNNPGNGTATVDLRGLGTNRTLVLINGTRAVPAGAGGAVDINTIPTALIENVEVLTGGASAVYGSDAVAGVINFKLKDDFEGVQFNAGYEATEKGDAEIFNTDLTIGGNFDDGKGNVVFNMSYTQRGDLFQADRSFSQTALFDDGDGGLEPGGSSGVPGTSIFSGGFGAFSPDSSGIIFGQDGSVRPFQTSGDTNDFYNYAPSNYIQLPQERHQITALGHYDLSDNMTIYGRGMFTDSNVPQQLAPTPIFQTSSFTLDGNPYITPEAQQIISDGIGEGVDTDGDGIDDTGSALLRRRLAEVGPRRSEDSYNLFQIQAGIKGYFGDSNWTYDAYYQTGKVTNTSAQLGNVNRARFDQALLLDLVADPTGMTCQDPSNNGSTSACAPINIFGEGNISEDGAAFLKTAVASVAVFDQKIASLNISGDTEGLFELPGGVIGLAFGVDHREEAFEFLPSQDLAAGTIAGFNGAPAVNGGYKVDEYYAEVFLPILSDAPLAETLELELAFRSANYDTVGSVESYKIAGAWAPFEELRFRAGFNTAVRAPNIGELFSPQGEGFPSASDPCASGGTDQSAAVRSLCEATGVPANVVFSNAIDPASGQVRNLSGGNPDLKQEEAETLTVGFVVTPTDNFSLSLDYFSIEIEDAVAAFGGGTNNILATCYDTANVAGGLGGDFCNAVNRRADGTIDFVQTASQNVASITLEGFDLAMNYELELDAGKVSVDYLGTVTEKSDFLPFTGGDTITCAGEFGADCGEPITEYKHRISLRWAMDDLTAQLLWRYVGEVNDDDDDSDYTVETISSFNYFDASASYNFSDNYRVTAGIDNLFDKKPPVIGDNDSQANTYPATYDVYGRTYFVNFSATF